MADMMQEDDITLNGEEEAVAAPAATVEHLAEGNSELLGIVLGDGVTLGMGR